MQLGHNGDDVPSMIVRNYHSNDDCESLIDGKIIQLVNLSYLRLRLHLCLNLVQFLSIVIEQPQFTLLFLCDTN